MKIKDEIIKRMKMLGVRDSDIQKFVFFECIPLVCKGQISEKNMKLTIERITKIHDEYGGYPIYLTYEYPFVNVIWLSSHKEEWKLDYDTYKNNVCFTYVINLADMIFSGFGYINFKNVDGIIVRV